MQLDPIGELGYWYVIPATCAIVAVLYVLLRRMLFTPYVAVLEERQARVDAGSERMAEAEAVAQQSVWDVAWIESEARSKAEAVGHEALEEAEAYRKRTMDQAIRDVDGMLATGRAQIAKDREQETARVRAEAISCVGIACVQLFGKADPLIVESSVDRAIDRLA
jgi:F-type H+-transporting ATPase subunit b